jgi:hypothetical protein
MITGGADLHLSIPGDADRKPLKPLIRARLGVVDARIRPAHRVVREIGPEQLGRGLRSFPGYHGVRVCVRATPPQHPYGAVSVHEPIPEGIPVRYLPQRLPGPANRQP